MAKLTSPGRRVEEHRDEILDGALEQNAPFPQER